MQERSHHVNVMSPFSRHDRIIQRVHQFFLKLFSVSSMAPTNPSVFMLNNSVMLSWGQPPSVGINGELLGYSVHIQESNTVILVGQCYLSMKLKKENISAESCVRVAAITKAGFGVPTSCVKIDLGEFTKP